MDGPDLASTNRWLMPLLRLRVRFAEIFRPSELQATIFWAGVIGCAGAIASVLFRRLVNVVHFAFTRHGGGYVESFSELVPWERLVIPTAGGLCAGVILFFGTRLARRKSSTDYMEAIVLGDGIVPARLSLVKCASALFSIASGASIGREGPLVQLSSMLASLFGRMRRLPAVRLRLLVACGAAAGIASAYNAPIGGAMFVSEIVLGSIAMETFGPLVFSSVIATLTVRQLLGANPLYEIEIPRDQVYSNWDILPWLLLGLLAGVLAPWFLRLLRASEKLFSTSGIPIYLRLAAGGLIVGALAFFHPEVCGNGYSVIGSVLKGGWLWQALLVVLVLKLLATAATFGSGAVGGVFTPTLFVGSCLGYIFAHLAQLVWPGPPLNATASTLIGMGAFLAATTHAPIMAIIILFELTLDYQIILPLMLACVIAHYTSRVFETDSIYSESLKRKGAGWFRERLADLRVADLMKPNPPAVSDLAAFAEIAQNFLTNRFHYLYVVDASGSFKGVVSLHDVKSYLNDPALAEIVIAKDILQEKFPTITPEQTLIEALDEFSRHAGERLPVTNGAAGGRRLLGSISKSDVMLALVERAGHESSDDRALSDPALSPETL